MTLGMLDINEAAKMTAALRVLHDTCVSECAAATKRKEK